MLDKDTTDWRVTATTIYCTAVDDEVTLLVHCDFTTKCTGFAKYGSSAAGDRSGCRGIDCPSLTEYRDKLARESAECQSAEKPLG